ncbi:MAG: type II toxin-antitoxin system RelE/ParE family toxin [Sphaerochaetaceae bacterium]|nr:type II toxin-antitoxin system RelE/ParE family toxin [Sphaerochaetaceae bacterium]
MSFLVEFYETSQKQTPFDEFLQGLAPAMKAKVLRDLELLESFGNCLREPYSKALGDGLFELRSKLSTTITRSIYFFVEGQRIIVTHGFVKKQKRTPKEEIERAESYRNDWKRRNGYGS